MSGLTLEHVGPIEQLAIAIPEGGGVVVLKGQNGKGKSLALEATERLVTGRGSVAVADGEVKAVVEGFGCRLTVGRSTRRTGELEVQSLEGKLDVAALVEPGLKDPAAADARRIKALVALLGAKAELELFHGLVGGADEFLRVCGPLAPGDDLVLLAERVKRKLEEAARGQEQQAEHAEGQAAADAAAANGMDLKAETNEDLLHEASQAAVIRQAQLREQRALADAAGLRATEARTRLTAAEASNVGPDTAEQQATVDQLRAAAEQRQADVSRLEVELDEARRRLFEASNQAISAAATLGACRDRDRQLAEARAALEAAVAVEGPGDAELAAAAELVAETQRRAEYGALVRQAQTRLGIANDRRQAAKKLLARAAQLREAAGGCDGVLSEVVARTGSRLRVEAGRLVLATERGPSTMFAELSDGQRWIEALDIAIAALPEGRGLLTIPQKAWEGIDPINRQAIAEHLVERGVVALTAQCDVGPLRAEVNG